MKRNFVFSVILILPLTGLLAIPVAGTGTYEAYYLYLGEHPSDGNPGWHEDVQGVTHDENYWFITHAQDGDPSDQGLWKIPVGHNLASVDPSDPGVKRILISDVHQLDQQGYWHWGDLSYYKFEGQGFLVIPIEFQCHAIAVFRANDLAYVDHFEVCNLQANASWCGVDPTTGYLYSSDSDNVSFIKKYDANWPAVKNNGSLVLAHVEDITLLNASGTSALSLDGVQGGVFSPSGGLLYIVAHGVHVFDTKSWRRVQRSTNGYGHFNYQFDPEPYPGAMEEPEGITIWDLDDGRAPGIRGQLHVLMLDNDVSTDDDIYFKHYTGTIYVHSAFFGDGRPFNPYHTVSEANNLVNQANWNGARIAITAGSYPEALTFSKQVQILAIGGTVSIGTGGHISLTTSGTINIYSGGALKIY